MMVLKGLGVSVEEQKSCRVARIGGLGGDLVGGKHVGEQESEGRGKASHLTGGAG